MRTALAADLRRGRPGLWRTLSFLVGLGTVLAGGPACGGDPLAGLPRGLPAEERATLERLLGAPDVSTRVEAQPFEARAELFEYLLDHPEFASHVARALRAARYRIWSTPEGLRLDDGWGTTGAFRVIYAANGTRLFHARGEYRPAVLPAIRGEAVTIIEYTLTPAGSGLSLVRPTVAGYLRLDNRLVAAALRVPKPLVQRKADLEARRLLKVFARVSRALAEDPARVWAVLQARPDVPARELEEFGRLLSRR